MDEIEIEDLPSDPGTRELPIDVVRKYLAYTAVGFFGLAMAAGFVGALWGAAEWERTKDFLLIVVPIITLMIGATMGHYFDRRV